MLTKDFLMFVIMKVSQAVSHNVCPSRFYFNNRLFMAYY